MDFHRIILWVSVPLGTWGVRGGPLTFPCWEFSTVGMMTSCAGAKEASSPMKGPVEAGCSGRLGNPALVSQTPIRFLGENPSASLGTHGSPRPPSLVSAGINICVCAASPFLTPAWVGTDLCRPRVKEVLSPDSHQLGKK